MELGNVTPCLGDCSTRQLRLKTIVEDGEAYIVPSGFGSAEYHDWIEYWWSFSTGAHVPLCSEPRP